MSDTVQYDLSDGVATVTLNRPDAMNALNTELKVALRDTLLAAAEDDAVRAVLLTGTGRAFCVGQDLAEHAQNLQGDEQARAAVWATVPEHYTPIATALATMPKPVVAAVNGVAAGAGAAFAFACDFRVVADSASFTMAFSAVGLAADSGSSWTLPRLVGMAKAKELLLLPSSSVGAAEARELGLATEVVPAGEVAGRARELAVLLAAGPTVAYGAIRRSLAHSGHGIEESLDFERQMMELTGSTTDHRGAVTSFLAKAEPTFEGR